jgi:iron complex outermembrane receptor protein
MVNNEEDLPQFSGCLTYNFYVMKNVITLIIFYAYASTLFAQQGISGKVFDEKTQEPLAGANVIVLGTHQGTITDISGAFLLDIDKDKYSEITVSYVGYDPMTINVRDSDYVSIPLSLAYRLDEVVIQAVRGSDDSPATRDLITKKDIEKVYIGQDALFVVDNLSPSIISYSESGTNVTNYGLMRLRGIDQSRINITLDGTPLNDMIDQGVFFSNFTDFSNSIESIQIERGVGTSTNGTASYAGSIDFQSVNLRNRDAGAEIQFTGGSFGTYRGSVELTSGMLAEKFNFYTRVTKIKTDGYRYHSGTDSYSIFFSGGYFGQKDMVTLKGFTGKTQNGLAYLPTAWSDIQVDPKTNYVNENDIDNFGQDFIQLQYTRSLTDYNSLVTTLYYGAAGGDYPAGFYVTDTIYHPGNPQGFEINERLVQINYPLFNNHYGFISYFNHHSRNEEFNLDAGLHLYTFQRKNLESIIPDNADPYYDERSWKNEISLFAKGDYHLGRFTVFGDMQLRTLTLEINPDETLLPNEPNIVKNWTFINPKIGMSYTLNDERNLYLYYGYSGREPTKIDILGGFQLNASNLESVLSDKVKPEYVHDLECGFRMTNYYFKGQVNAFYMNFENEIAPIGKYVPEGFIQLRKNIPSSFRAGIEFNWNWNFIPSFEFNGNATFMKSRIKEYAPEEDPKIYTNVSQPFSPDFMITGSLVYKYRQIFDVEISGKYVTESFLEPTNMPEMILPSFFVTNMRFGINFYKNNRFEIFFNNIFNKQYFTYGAPVDPNYDGNLQPGYFVQPPRNLFLQLTINI